MFNHVCLRLPGKRRPERPPRRHLCGPAKVYLALYLNDPGEDGASGTEVSYAGYKRIEIDFSSPAETNGGIGVQNLEDITFPTPVTAAGTITHVGILDSLAGGNMLCRGEALWNPS